MWLERFGNQIRRALRILQEEAGAFEGRGIRATVDCGDARAGGVEFEPRAEREWGAREVHLMDGEMLLDLRKLCLRHEGTKRVANVEPARAVAFRKVRREVYGMKRAGLMVASAAPARCPVTDS